MIQSTVSASWLRGLIEIFAAEGLNKEELLSGCGLLTADLENPARRFPSTLTALLWDLAIARSDKQNLGLNRDLIDRYGGIHSLGYAIMACPTLFEGLQTVKKYLAVLSEAPLFAMVKEERGYWIYGNLQGEKHAPRQRVEFGFLMVLMVCTWFTRTKIRPQEMEFIYPLPTNLQCYKDMFLVDVRFNQQENRMLLSHRDLQLTLPCYDPLLASSQANYLQQQLLLLGHNTFRHQVFNEILQCLKAGEARRAEVARRLRLSERTLQRRLQEENISFQVLLDEARRELAKQYLADERLSLVEVADLLGFSDKSNLFRASRRWFGVSPLQYRDKVGSEKHG